MKFLSNKRFTISLCQIVIGEFEIVLEPKEILSQQVVIAVVVVWLCTITMLCYQSLAAFSTSEEIPNGRCDRVGYRVWVEECNISVG